MKKGEIWHLKPRQDPHNPHLWSPGIKYGVQNNSFTHQTELFGPLLAVMCAKNLDHAIALANHTAYGLTSGLHSLDPREHDKWLQKIEAGNCYINRGITGAIVSRQPFGGCKASSFGIGMKAGGPNYLLQLIDGSKCIGNEVTYQAHALEAQFAAMLDPPDRKIFLDATHSYAIWWKQYFSKTHTLRRLVGQDNLLTFRPKDMCIVIYDSDPLLDSLLVLSAALIVGGKIRIGMQDRYRVSFQSLLPVTSIEEAFQPHCHVRALQPLALHAFVDSQKPSRHGRIELLHYVREISISKDYHRYGNLMDRDQEVREMID